MIPHSVPFLLAGLVLTLAGLALALWARTALGGNWSGIVTLKEDHELIRHGPYGHVRHPIYSAILLMVLGSALAIGTIGALVGLPLIGLGVWLKVRQEEALMTAHFPAEYPIYRTEVRALIPAFSEPGAAGETNDWRLRHTGMCLSRQSSQLRHARITGLSPDGRCRADPKLCCLGVRNARDPSQEVDLRPVRTQLAVCAALALALAGCSAGSSGSGGPDPDAVRLSITPAGGRTDTSPERGITVRAANGKISEVVARSDGERVSGRLNAARTVWHSTWALNVSSRYTVTATAAGQIGRSGHADQPFRTLKPTRPSRPRSSRGTSRPTASGCRSSSTSAGRSPTGRPSNGRSR